MWELHDFLAGRPWAIDFGVIGLIWLHTVAAGRLAPAKRVGAVLFGSQSNGGYPLIDKLCVLARAQVPSRIDPAGERRVVDASTSTLKPSAAPKPTQGPLSSATSSANSTKTAIGDEAAC